MIDGFRVHGADDANVVGNTGRVGEELADPHAALPMLRKGKARCRHGEIGLSRGHAGESLAHADAVRQFRGVEVLQARFIVEGLYLGRGARLKEIDDPFGPGCDMGHRFFNRLGAGAGFLHAEEAQGGGTEATT